MYKQVQVFKKYLRNCVVYKYVLYIIRKVFLQCFYLFLMHKVHVEIAEKLQVKYLVFHIHWCL